MISSQAGATVWRWDQAEPFGDSVPNSDPDGDGIGFDFPLRFPGQYADLETNLAYNHWRDHDAAIGRYVESDPVGLSGGLNTYLYVRANPTRYIDPSGLKTCGSGKNEPFVPDNPLFYPFSDCCQNHDDCYDDCKNGPSKEQCDTSFYTCMKHKCSRYAGAYRWDCNNLADTYHWFVVTGGLPAFIEARSKCRGVCRPN